MTSVSDLFNLLESNNFSVFKAVADASRHVRVACERDGDLLLHRAVALGSLAACRYLLGRGIPADCPGSRGATPLHYAACRGDVTITRILLQAAGRCHSPTNINGMTPLHVAAGQGNLAVARILLAKGAACSARDKYDRLPLHYAAGTDQLAVVRWLLRHDPSQFEQPDAFGQRPLHWALQYQCNRTAAWLVGCGVDRKASDIHGRSPLYFLRIAEESGSSSPMLRALAPEIKESRACRLTVIQRAILRGDIKEAKELMKKPAAMNLRGELGRTALHTAAFSGNRDLFRWLRKKGADSAVLDDYGWTPIKLLSYRLIERPTG